MATTTVEGFSITHAAILNGLTGAEETDGDIYGVREGSLEVDMDTYDNTGDNQVLSSWFWYNFATVTIKSGYIPFKTITLLTGSTTVSSGTAPNDYYNLPLWAESSLNQTTRPMLIRIPSKDSAGVVRLLDIVLYKVQFQPINFEGPVYKEGLVVNYSGKALVSNKTETGSAVPNKSDGTPDLTIGRLISRPG